MDEKKGLETLIFMALVGLFALVGASGRVLMRWQDIAERSITHAIGTCIVSMFAAWLVGLFLWESYAAQPALLLAITGFASWLGGELIDRLARKIEQMFLGGNENGK